MKTNLIPLAFGISIILAISYVGASAHAESCEGAFGAQSGDRTIDLLVLNQIANEKPRTIEVKGEDGRVTKHRDVAKVSIEPHLGYQAEIRSRMLPGPQGQQPILRAVEIKRLSPDQQKALDLKIEQMLRWPVESSNEAPKPLTKETVTYQPPVVGLPSQRIGLNSATTLVASPIPGVFVVGTIDGSLKLVGYGQYFVDLAPFSVDSKLGSNRIDGVLSPHIESRASGARDAIVDLTFTIEVLARPGEGASAVLPGHTSLHITYGDGRVESYLINAQQLAQMRKMSAAIHRVHSGRIR